LTLISLEPATTWEVGGDQAALVDDEPGADLVAARLDPHDAVGRLLDDVLGGHPDARRVRLRRRSAGHREEQEQQ